MKRRRNALQKYKPNNVQNVAIYFGMETRLKELEDKLSEARAVININQHANSNIVDTKENTFRKGILSAFDLTGNTFNRRKQYRHVEKVGFSEDIRARQNDYLNWAGDIKKTIDKLKTSINSEQY